MAQNQTQLIRGIILSAIVVLAAALGSLLYAETATVKLSVPPQKLGATATLSGSQTGGDLKRSTSTRPPRNPSMERR